jgi:hypothetical protein
MTLKEKVNKFEFMDDVWVLYDIKISKGYYVGYCGDLDTYSVLFDYGDNGYDVHQYHLCDVFENQEDAERELAVRNINTLQRQIDAIKKEYNL